METTLAALEPVHPMPAIPVLRQSATPVRRQQTAVLTRLERFVLMTQTSAPMTSVTAQGHACTPTTLRPAMTVFSAQKTTHVQAEPARVLQLTVREQATSATTEYVMRQQISASRRQKQTEHYAMTAFIVLRQMNVTWASVTAAMIPALTTEIIVTVWSTAKKTFQLSFAVPPTR